VFMMEYCDFIENFEVIRRTQLFDTSWVQSAHWLNVRSRPLGSAWQFGDVSCELFESGECWMPVNDDRLVTFSTAEKFQTILVLSQSDTRFFQSISSPAKWSFDFKLFKVGSKEVIGSSTHSPSWARSATLRIELLPGDYVVQVRRA
jgi:hypothetical protein